MGFCWIDQRDELWHDVERVRSQGVALVGLRPCIVSPFSNDFYHGSQLAESQEPHATSFVILIKDLERSG